MNNGKENISKINSCRRMFGIFTLVYCGLAVYLYLFVLPAFNLAESQKMNEVWRAALYTFLCLSCLYILVDFAILSRMKHRLKFGIAAILLFLLFLHTDRALQVERSVNPDLYRYSPTLGWEMAPNSIGFNTSTNSLGFRLPEFAPVKQPGQYRIIVLGNSVAMGSGVAGEYIFTSVLQEMLKKEYPEKDIRVLNCAVNGYNIVQIERLMQEKVWALGPDMVILAFNFTPPRQEDESFYPDPRPRPWLRPVFTYLYRSWIFHERIMIKNHIYRKFYKGPDVIGPLKREPQHFYVGKEEFFSVLGKLFKTAREKGVNVFLTPTPGTRLHGNLMEFTESYDMDYWIVSNDWDEYDSHAFLEDRAHLSVKGHRKFAVDLFERIKRSNLLK